MASLSSKINYSILNVQRSFCPTTGTFAVHKIIITNLWIIIIIIIYLYIKLKIKKLEKKKWMYIFGWNKNHNDELIKTWSLEQ